VPRRDQTFMKIAIRSKRIDLTGERFGRLVVLELEGRRRMANGESLRYWKCRCDCGGIVSVRTGSLIPGKSCGCLRKEAALAATTIHGMAKRSGMTSEYRAWVHMRERCSNPNDTAWVNYGGRGISVCKRWRESFENFLADMGPKPSREHSIDRIDNNGNYEPSNCRWATRAQQNANRRKFTIPSRRKSA
jgi:hypothetical protein